MITARISMTRIPADIHGTESTVMSCTTPSALIPRGVNASVPLSFSMRKPINMNTTQIRVPTTAPTIPSVEMMSIVLPPSGRTFPYKETKNRLLLTYVHYTKFYKRSQYYVNFPNDYLSCTCNVLQL